MKKFITLLSTMFVLGGVVYAGNQYNWGTSTGGSWYTPDDTTTKPNQVLQIGSGSQTVVNQSSMTLPGTLVLNQGIASGVGLTVSLLQNLTPSTTGQIAWCSNCTNTLLVISTGTGVGAFVGVYQSTTSQSALQPVK